MNRFNAPDGTSLVFDAYEPARPKAAVLFLHGWSDHAGRWAATGTRLQAAGFGAYPWTCAGMDVQVECAAT